MADVKDILGVPRAGPGPAAQEEVKEKKEKVKRPQGMSREAFALLDSSHPVAPSQLVDTFKKKKDAKTKPKASTKGTVTFQWKSFHNPARTDKLELFHWVKGYKDVTGRVRDADESEYQFAKYNKKVRQLLRSQQAQICLYRDHYQVHVAGSSVHLLCTAKPCTLPYC
jgi:DNA methyltransferase 1-associated protein 1